MILGTRLPFVNRPLGRVSHAQVMLVTMSDLASKECVPCRGGVPPLEGDQLRALEAELGNDWQVVDDHHLVKEYKFGNFQEALDFANRVGALSEEVNHHPEICFTWGRVTLTIWTHKIDGLNEADFVWAAKADTLAG